MKKLLILLTALFVIPFAHASTMLRPLEYMGELIFQIGSFVWVTDRISATKFALFIVIFALIYTVLAKGIGGRSTGVFNKSGGNKVSAVIAFAMAAIAVIFIPDGLVQQIGVMYSGVLAIIIIAIPVGLVLFFGIWVTREDQGEFMGRSMSGDSLHWNNKTARHAIRLITGLMALFLLFGFSAEYGAMLSVLPGGLMWRRF
jgi:hypothetical protein